MKTWNLSSFEDLSARVLSSVDKNSSTGIQLPKRVRGTARTARSASMGAATLLAAIAVSSLHLSVSGSDLSLRLKVEPGIWSVAVDRPPLRLLFGGKHPLKWDAETERQMLERALAATGPASESESRMNAIYSVLEEDPPADREALPDLSSLGVKLG
jgi:hypothetical protein